MNTRALILIISLFSVIVFFSGCLGESEEQDLFIGGDQALEFTFSSNAPPERVRAGELFDISLFVENKGEAKVAEEALLVNLNNGAVFDVEPRDFVKVNEEELQPAVKQEVGSLPGGYTYIEYYGLKYIGESITEESPVSLSVETCYPYYTKSVSQICVAKDMDESEVCQPLGAKIVESSGAPVTVDLFEQKSNGVQRISGTQEERNTVTTRVKIEISKLDDYRIYPIQYNCKTKESVGGEGATLSRVRVDTKEIDIEEACGGDEIFFNSEGVGKFDCLLDIPEVYSDYEARFEVVLSYKISDIINKQISILST